MQDIADSSADHHEWRHPAGMVAESTLACRQRQHKEQRKDRVKDDVRLHAVGRGQRNAVRGLVQETDTVDATCSQGHENDNGHPWDPYQPARPVEPIVRLLALYRKQRLAKSATRADPATVQAAEHDRGQGHESEDHHAARRRTLTGTHDDKFRR